MATQLRGHFPSSCVVVAAAVDANAASTQGRAPYLRIRRFPLRQPHAVSQTKEGLVKNTPTTFIGQTATCLLKHILCRLFPQG